MVAAIIIQTVGRRSIQSSRRYESKGQVGCQGIWNLVVVFVTAVEKKMEKFVGKIRLMLNLG